MPCLAVPCLTLPSRALLLASPCQVVPDPAGPSPAWPSLASFPALFLLHGVRIGELPSRCSRSQFKLGTHILHVVADPYFFRSQSGPICACRNERGPADLAQAALEFIDGMSDTLMRIQKLKSFVTDSFGYKVIFLKELLSPGVRDRPEPGFLAVIAETFRNLSIGNKVPGLRDAEFFLQSADIEVSRESADTNFNAGIHATPPLWWP